MNYYEIYCEDTNGLCFTNNNFSFFVRSDKKPTIRAITRKFKKRIGKYFVNGIWACDWANNDMNYVRKEAIAL